MRKDQYDQERHDRYADQISWGLVGNRVSVPLGIRMGLLDGFSMYPRRLGKRTYLTRIASGRRQYDDMRERPQLNSIRCSGGR
nr:MAG TPA: hypothetical protein [Caudoviricetes sp.]